MLYILVMHPNFSVDSLVESLNEQKQPFHELRDTGVLEFLTEIWPLTQFSENYFEPTGSFRDRRRCKDGMQLTFGSHYTVHALVFQCDGSNTKHQVTKSGRRIFSVIFD